MRSHRPVEHDVPRTLALLAAIAFTAAVGLAAIDEQASGPMPTALGAEADRLGRPQPVESATDVSPSAGERDPVLHRTDRAGARHG
jgi:hypothetical protein